MRPNSGGVLVAILIACGGTPTQGVATPLPSATAQASPTAGTRGPSDAVLRAWPMADAPSVAYADLDGLGHTKLFEGLLIGILSMPSLVSAEQATCARALASGMKEVALGVHAEHLAVVARFDKDTPSLGQCVTQVFGAPSAPVSSDGLVVYTRGLTASPGNPTALRTMRLHQDEYLVGRVNETDGTTVEFALSDSSEHFEIDARVDMRDDSAAAVIEQGLKISPDSLASAPGSLKPDELAAVTRLLKALHVTRKGSHVDVVFDLREPPVDQARDLGVASALAIHGVRRYLLESKKAEAQNNIGAISKDIAESWERESLDPARAPKQKKLQSFPPVPKTVPRGTKYVSTPVDWKPWDAIKFEIDQPQYFQYEVRAAPDGQSADIIAHGDLNGDGKVSTFTLSVRVDKRTKHLAIAAAPVVVDADE